MITLVSLTENDINVLTPIMKRAFDEDTNIHLGKAEGGPTGYHNGELLLTLGLHKDTETYTILYNDQIIGAVILWINNETNHNILDMLFIDPTMQEKGIGVNIWQQIEGLYPNTTAWHTETPSYSRRNHHFYVNKCGFHIVAIKNPKSVADGSFILEKQMQ